MDKTIAWLVGPFRLIRLIGLLCSVLPASAQSPVWQNDAFTIQLRGNCIAGLRNSGDRYHTNFIRKDQVFGEVIIHGDTSTLKITPQWRLEGSRLLWTITIRNTGRKPAAIDDLALPLPYNSGGGENPAEIFEQHVVKHHFIAGNNSFIYFERPTGMGPFLLMLPTPGTSLEYFTTADDDEEPHGPFRVFIHSAGIAQSLKKGSWRQPHTRLVLPPGGQKQYGFVFRWADSYQEVRNAIVEEGGIDVRTLPGMTIPTDLDATIALRTRLPLRAITAEFPARTTIAPLPQRRQGTFLYRIHFTRLGENKLSIVYGNNAHTALEFFVTEPLETLYKKRAAFIVDHQQHRDSTKWYDGLFSVYDMQRHVLRGPDNPDYFDTSRLSYVLTCDDPILCKAPFVAAKNVFYPSQHEIDALEYYIRHFVWGKLQRTDKELPNPYGLYGTPNWRANRDTARRQANLKDPNRFKMHIWRSYDYPHIVMLYYHLYQVARDYPGMTHYLDAKGYLQRAKETAKAFFTYPYEILPWYETYKWGCYNELLFVPLIADLEKEGYFKDAGFLRDEWEKKVKYFLYDDPYPFRSEYAIDATAFESSYALAKYATTHPLLADSNLWFDKNRKRWYSHPHIDTGDAPHFMRRQLAANIALRGAIEPAYYYLGSDYRGRSDNFTLTYMTQMGGWAILDYGLHFAPDTARTADSTSTPVIPNTPGAADCISLGYAAYLAPFALMNTGTPASDYGFWYPGKDNDGASGWAFESQQYTNTWIQKPQGRGPWYYDGEVDLGYGGATRAAATIVTNDPVFGLTAYGGSLSRHCNQLSVIPRDGLRTRLFYRNGKAAFDLLLQRDGLAKNIPVVFSADGKDLRFFIENRTGDTHLTHISLTKDGRSTDYAIVVKPGAPAPLHLHSN